MTVEAKNVEANVEAKVSACQGVKLLSPDNLPDTQKKGSEVTVRTYVRVKKAYQYVRISTEFLPWYAQEHCNRGTADAYNTQRKNVHEYVWPLCLVSSKLAKIS